MILRIALIYRPVASELYELETEIGPTYYDEVVGPEFRSVARGVAARHPYMELHRKNEQIEDEVEADLRRRTAGKHVEIASVTLESIQYEPAILKAVQDKLAAEQDSARQKTVLENEGMRKRLELQYQAEQEKMRADASLREKQRELELTKAQAETDRVKEESEAAKRVIQARGEAQAAKFSAQALSEREKAHNQALTPLAVMEKGFEALKALAGTGTNVLIGDWSKVPNFLFPNLNAFKASGIRRRRKALAAVEPSITAPQARIAPLPLAGLDVFLARGALELARLVAAKVALVTLDRERHCRRRHHAGPDFNPILMARPHRQGERPSPRGRVEGIAPERLIAQCDGVPMTWQPGKSSKYPPSDETSLSSTNCT
jgi:regulator of protease activity HflC (stomatin/prohibitin superfamily)